MMIRNDGVIRVRGTVIIEVCSSNLACQPSLMSLEEEFADVSVLENDCMSECELCEAFAYVFLNGDKLTAATPTQLMDELRRRLTSSGE